MDTERVDDWLEAHVVGEGNSRFLVGAGSVVAGLVLAVVGFWVTYVVIFLAARVFCAIPSLFTNAAWKLSGSWNLLLTQLFTVLLFWTEWKGSRRPVDLADWSAEPSVLGQGLARISGSGGVRFAPLLHHPEITAGIVLDLLGVGPRMLCHGFRLFIEGYRLRTADRSAASESLVVLLVAGQKVAYDDLVQQIHPERLREAFRLLQTIEGVHFLDSGLHLTTELRTALLADTRA